MPDFAGSLGFVRSMAIYYGQPWRRHALRRFYAGLVRQGDLVFDIGAHVGSRTRTLSALGARIVAVEPQPRFAEFLARHIVSERVTLVRKAVGEREGQMTLHVSSRHPTVSSMAEGWIERVKETPGFAGVAWDQRITVPVTTLDALIAEHGLPNFCKIDVEGAEAAILRGLSQLIPLIAFEYLPSVADLSLGVVERLEALGHYRFNRVVGERHSFHHAEWLDGREIVAELRAMPADAPSGDIYARLA